MSQKTSEFTAAANEILPVVISRAEIPAITHVTIGGVERYIGEVRDFRGNLSLSDFLPNEGRTSLSWVRLQADELHQVHKHPTASMVIICEGQGELIGDTQKPVAAGDLVIIPPNALHGFIGRGNAGLWGLSVQFEGSGLYEHADKPRMQLAAEDKYKPLEDAQALHVTEYGNNQLVGLVKTNDIRGDNNLKASLLDVLQVWSDHFQKLIRIRSASTKDSHFSALADRHMRDEFDHNQILADMRGNRPVKIWDAALESAAAWFAERMAHASDTDATIIMHLVIEEAGDVFHKFGAQVFPNTRHFDFHGNHDEDHADMGLQILKQRSLESIEHMIEVLNQGWAMMNLLCNRMAEVAIANAHSPTPPQGMKREAQPLEPKTGA